MVVPFTAHTSCTVVMLPLTGWVKGRSPCRADTILYSQFHSLKTHTKKLYDVLKSTMSTLSSAWIHSCKAAVLQQTLEMMCAQAICLGPVVFHRCEGLGSKSQALCPYFIYQDWFMIFDFGPCGPAQNCRRRGKQTCIQGVDIPACSCAEDRHTWTQPMLTVRSLDSFNTAYRKYCRYGSRGTLWAAAMQMLSYCTCSPTAPAPSYSLQVPCTLLFLNKDRRFNECGYRRQKRCRHRPIVDTWNWSELCELRNATFHFLGYYISDL